MKNWRWHLIPEAQHSKLIDAHDRGDYAGVREIFNRYKVVPGMLSACCGLEQLIAAVPYAKHNGIIQDHEEVRDNNS